MMLLNLRLEWSEVCPLLKLLIYINQEFSLLVYTTWRQGSVTSVENVSLIERIPLFSFSMLLDAGITRADKIEVAKYIEGHEILKILTWQFYFQKFIKKGKMILQKQSFKDIHYGMTSSLQLNSEVPQSVCVTDTGANLNTFPI